MRDDAGMDAEPRRSVPRGALLFAALVVLALPVTLWLAARDGDGRDGGEPSRRLTAEPGFNPDRAEVELIVTVPESSGAAAAGDPVVVECWGPDGARVLRTRHRLPLDTDDGTLDPHAHVPLGERDPAELARCRMTGLGATYEGPVNARAGGA